MIFEVRDHGLSELCRYFNVRQQCAVYPETDTGFGFARHELNVNV